MLRIDRIVWGDDNSAVISFTATTASELPNIGDQIGGAIVSAGSTAMVEQYGQIATLSSGGAWNGESGHPITSHNSLPAEILVSGGISLYPPELDEKSALEMIEKSISPTNLLKTQRYATLASGVRVIPKKDGTYALGGTCTSGTFIPKIGLFSDIPASYIGKKMKLTGGISSRIFLRIYNGNTNVAEETGSGYVFTLTEDMLSYDIRLGVKKDEVCDGIVLKPMLCVEDESGSYIPYIATNNELRQDNARFNTGKFTGKSYIAIGDSVTEYQGTTASPHPSQSWVYGYIEAIEDDYGMVCTNMGKAGHTIVQDLATLLAASYTNAALVTIAYGMNDARLALTLGNTTDEYDESDPTFCGALNALIDKIYSDNAFCNIIVLSPNQRNVVGDFGSFTENSNGKTLEDFANACGAVAAYKSAQFVDMFHSCGISKNTYTTLLKDGVHPNTSGYKRMYAAMRSALANLVVPKD